MKTNSDKINHFTRWCSVGFAVANFTSLMVILPLESISPLLFLASLIFSASLPINIFMYIVPILRKKMEFDSWAGISHATAIIVFYPLNLLGIGLLFFHLSCLHGLLFLGVSLLLIATQKFRIPELLQFLKNPETTK